MWSGKLTLRNNSNQQAHFQCQFLTLRHDQTTCIRHYLMSLWKVCFFCNLLQRQQKYSTMINKHNIYRRTKFTGQWKASHWHWTTRLSFTGEQRSMVKQRFSNWKPRDSGRCLTFYCYFNNNMLMFCVKCTKAIRLVFL